MTENNGGWGADFLPPDLLGGGDSSTATLPGGWDDEFLPPDLAHTSPAAKEAKRKQYADDYAAMADQIEQQRANAPKPWDLPPNATELETLNAKRLKQLYTGDEEGLANRQRRIADFQQWYDTETDPERKKEALLALQMERSSEQAHRERMAAEQADLGLRGITPEQKMLEEREAVERGLGPDMAIANAPVMRGAITGTSNADSSIGEIAMRLLPGEGAPSEMADVLGRERMAEGQYQAYLDEKQGTAAALTNQLSQMTAEYLPLAASGVPAWLQVGAKGANDAYLKSDSDAYALTSGVIQGAATFFGGKLAGGTWIDMLSGKVAGKTIGPMLKTIGPMLKGFGIESGEELSQLYLQALVDRGFGVGDGKMPTMKDAMWTLAVTAVARVFGSIMSGSIEDDGTPTVLSGDRALNAADRAAGRAANAIQEKIKAFVDSERPSRKAAKEVGVDQIATTAKERSELAADIRNRLTGQQFEEQLRAAAVSPAQAELDLEGWRLLAAAAGESFDDFVGKRVKAIEKTTSDKSVYLAQRQSGRPDSLAQDQDYPAYQPSFNDDENGNPLSLRQLLDVLDRKNPRAYDSATGSGLSALSRGLATPENADVASLETDQLTRLAANLYDANLEQLSDVIGEFTSAANAQSVKVLAKELQLQEDVPDGELNNFIKEYGTDTGYARFVEDYGMPVALMRALRAAAPKVGKGDRYFADFYDTILGGPGQNFRDVVKTQDQPAAIDTPEFKAWFGASKVTDADGKPLIVYHGTTSPSEFNKFEAVAPTDVLRVDGQEVPIANSWDMGRDSKGMPEGYHYGAVTDARQMGAQKAYEFRLEEAKRFAKPDGSIGDDAARHIADLKRLIGKTIDKSTETRPSGDGHYFTPSLGYSFTRDIGNYGNGRVIPVYLSIKNPKVMNASEIESAGRSWRVEELKKQGYDGAIFASDPKDITKDGWSGATQIVAFDPTQIKSAIGNSGKFDPDDPSILAQKKGPTPRGEVQFHKDGRATIRLFETANESTFTHETAHILRRYLQGEDLKKAERWAGARGGRWDRKAEEKFARGWERYLRDGIAPNKALESIFARFKAALSRVYSVVAKSPLNVDITPEMRGVFDRLLVPAEARTTSPGNFSRKVDNPQSQAAAVEVSDADVLAETRGLSPTSNKNATVDEERARRGLPPMMAPAREANADAWDAAMRKIDRNPNHAEELQQSLAKSPRAVTAEENAALLHRRVTLRNDYYDALEQWQDATAAGNTELAAELDARVSAASDRLADLEEVTKAVGTESGRSLQARKMMAEEDYSLARMEMETAQAKGGPLTAEERQEVVDQNKKIVEKQKQLDEHEAVTEAAEETKAVAEAMEEAKKPAPGKTPIPGKKPQAAADPQQDIDAAIAAIKAKVDKEETSSITPFVQKLAKLFWQQGIREQEPMIDALHGVLEPMIPGWTRDQTQRAFSGYGNFSPLSKDEMSVGLRDLKGQTQQLLKIEALEARKPLEKTGVERRQPSFEERRLQKIVNELKRKYGVVVTDPETQLKSALEARKTYYRNRLVDLKQEIDSRQRVIKDKSPSPTDPELESLIAEYREVQTQHQEIFGKREMTDAERLKLALAAAEKTEARWQERLAAAKEGKFDPATGEKRKLTSPELEAVRARSEAIREEVELLKSLDSNINEQRQVNSLAASLADVEAKINSGDIAAPKRPFGPDSKAVSELKGKLDAARDRLKAMREAGAEYKQKQLDAAKAATQAAIDSLAKRIAAGDISISKSGKAGPVDSELKLLRYQREYLNKVMADLRNAAKPKKTAEQIALQSLKARMKNEAAKLAEKLAAGDFSETPRKTGPKLDAEGAKLKAELDMLRKEYREGLERDRWNKSSIWQKGKRYAVDAYDLGRLLMTTGEMSFLLRQGKLAAVSHPIKTGRALGAAFRAMRNETTARAIENQIISHPKFDEAKAARLHLTDEDSSLNKQEEFLTSRLAGRIPGVAAFARAGRVFMNKLRFDMYLAMEKAATRTGTATEEERNAIATFINESTGRGGLGKVGEPAAVFLGRMLFSPRYLASRFQMLAGHSMWGGTNRSRKLIAKEYGRIIAGMGVYYSLLAMLFSLGDEEKDGSVVTDPRSSDFGKIRIGDSRLDPMAGLSQVVTLISRLTTGETKTVSGKVLPLRGKTKFGQRDAFRVMADFARSKAHPFPATIINLLAGKDLAGEEVTVAGEAARSAAPITYKDIYDALREHGLAEGGALGLLAFFGEGLQHYGKN